MGLCVLGGFKEKLVPGTIPFFCGDYEMLLTRFSGIFL
jgi:hypothetical protein